jgi:hypothetical protein
MGYQPFRCRPITAIPIPPVETLFQIRSQITPPDPPVNTRARFTSRRGPTDQVPRTPHPRTSDRARPAFSIVSPARGPGQSWPSPGLLLPVCPYWLPVSAPQRLLSAITSSLPGHLLETITATLQWHTKLSCPDIGYGNPATLSSHSSSSQPVFLPLVHTHV